MRESERLLKLAKDARDKGCELASAQYELAAQEAKKEERLADQRFSWIAAGEY